MMARGAVMWLTGTCAVAGLVLAASMVSAITDGRGSLMHYFIAATNTLLALWCVDRWRRARRSKETLIPLFPALGA